LTLEEVILKSNFSIILSWNSSITLAEQSCDLKHLTSTLTITCGYYGCMDIKETALVKILVRQIGQVMSYPSNGAYLQKIN